MTTPRIPWLLAALLLAACPPSPPPPLPDLPGPLHRGTFSLGFDWPPGLPVQRDLWVVAKVEEVSGGVTTRVSSQDGPKQFHRGQPTEFHLEVETGKQSVVRVEFRDEPALVTHVRYYGLSDPFTLQPNEDRAVAVRVPIRAVPCEVSPVDGSACSVGVTSVNPGLPDGVTAQGAVRLVFHAPGASAVMFSNFRDFPADPGSTAEALRPDAGAWEISGWNLLPPGAECDAGPGCQRVVYARFRDQDGYISDTQTGMVQLDGVPPRLLAQSRVDPPVAGSADQVVVRLVTDEPALVPELLVNGQPALFTRITPSQDVATTAFIFQAPASRLGPDGPKEVSVRLTDLAGNGDGDPAVVGTIEVDLTTPELGPLEVDSLTRRQDGMPVAAPGLDVQFHFTTGEDLREDGGVAATVGSASAQCQADPADAGVRYRCHHVIAPEDGTPEREQPGKIVVTAWDGAGNASRQQKDIVFDFQAPLPLSAAVTLKADGDRPQKNPAKASAGTTVTVTLVANEDLAEAPRSLRAVNAAGRELQFQADNVLHDAVPSATQFTLRFCGAADVDSQACTPPEDGDYALEVTWSDLGGNRAPARWVTRGRPVLDGGAGEGADAGAEEAVAVQVWTQPPVLQLRGPLVFFRSPFGQPGSSAQCGVESDAPAEPCFALLSQDGGSRVPAEVFSVQDGGHLTMLRVWPRVVVAADGGSRLVAIGQPLGQFDAPGAGGAWPPMTVAATDNPYVAVSAVDEAGNESPPVAVEAAELVVTPAEAAGSTNPNRVLGTRWAQSTLVPVPGTGVTLDHGVGSVDSAPLWRERQTPTDMPGALVGVGLAHDPARGRTVLFGGVGANKEVWEWDGMRFDHRYPLVAPATRGDGSLVYFPPLDRVVAFGGAVGGRWFNDSWAWDGESWVDRTAPGCTEDVAAPRALPDGGVVAPVCPRPREAAAVAYDPDHARMVVVGGGRILFPPEFYPDSWAWDGSAWTLLDVAAAPPGRVGGVLAYDGEGPGSGRLLLFGGFNYSGTLGDLWEYREGTWTQLTVVGPAPRARVGHAMVGLPGGGVLLFGGCGVVDLAAGPDVACTETEYLDDLWVLHGRSWQQVDKPLDGSPWPQARLGPAYAYDGERGVLQIFSGRVAGTEDVMFWEWDGGRWHHFDRLMAKPNSTIRPAVVYHQAAHHLLVFSGQMRLATAPESTWTWDGWTWMQRTAVGPEGMPAARWGAATGYDPLHPQVLMFGGETPAPVDGPYLPGLLDDYAMDLWSWDGALWHRLLGMAATGAPSSREEFSGVYVPAEQTFMVFGGEPRDNSASAHGDTWTWTAGGGWREAPDAGLPAPAPREDYSVVLDPEEQRALVFGGRAFPVLLNDFWAWQGGNWTELAAPDGGVPEPRFKHAATWDPVRRCMVLSGGYGEQAFFDDLWEWRPAQGWLRRAVTGLTPGLRADHRLAYDPDRNVIDMFGNPMPDSSSNLWELDAQAARRPAVQVTVNAGDMGVRAGDLTGVDVRLRAGGTAFQGGAAAGSVLWGWATRQDGAEQWATATHAGWRALADNGAAATAPGDLAWFADAARARRYFQDQDGRLSFQVRPQAGAGTGPEEARVSLERVEVRVRYRLVP